MKLEANILTEDESGEKFLIRVEQSGSSRTTVRATVDTSFDSSDNLFWFNLMEFRSTSL